MNAVAMTTTSVPIPPPTTENTGPEELGGEAGFESAQFVARANEDIVNRRNSAAHVVGGQNLHQRMADDNADVVERAGEKEHDQRQPVISRNAEDDGGDAKARDGEQEITPGFFHRRQDGRSGRAMTNFAANPIAGSAKPLNPIGPDFKIFA